MGSRNSQEIHEGDSRDRPGCNATAQAAPFGPLRPLNGDAARVDAVKRGVQQVGPGIRGLGAAFLAFSAIATGGVTIAELAAGGGLTTLGNLALTQTGYARLGYAFVSGKGLDMVRKGVGIGAANEGSTALATTLQISKHAAQRMAERGFTRGMIRATIENGARYWDPKNGTFNYVLKSGFASGKDALVGLNPVTNTVTTVLRGSVNVGRMIPF